MIFKSGDRVIINTTSWPKGKTGTIYKYDGLTDYYKVDVDDIGIPNRIAFFGFELKKLVEKEQNKMSLQDQIKKLYESKLGYETNDWIDGYSKALEDLVELNGWELKLETSVTIVEKK